MTRKKKRGATVLWIHYGKHTRCSRPLAVRIAGDAVGRRLLKSEFFEKIILKGYTIFSTYV
jgi:hypothetical protein